MTDKINIANIDGNNFVDLGDLVAESINGGHVRVSNFVQSKYFFHGRVPIDYRLSTEDKARKLYDQGQSFNLPQGQSSMHIDFDEDLATPGWQNKRVYINNLPEFDIHVPREMIFKRVGNSSKIEADFQETY